MSTSFEVNRIGEPASAWNGDAIGDSTGNASRNARRLCSKSFRFGSVTCGIVTLVIILLPAIVVIWIAIQHPRDQYPLGLPSDVEFVYVRHGMSTMNAPLDVFNERTQRACRCTSTRRLRVASVTTCNMPDEVCKRSHPIAKDANKRALWVNRSSLGNSRSPLPAYLVQAANALLDNRMFFDAPLTKEGLLQARELHQHTSKLQQEWLSEHENHQNEQWRLTSQIGDESMHSKSISSTLNRSKVVLVSSNLVRAVDTLLNGFSHLADSSIPFFLHTALQEYSVTGNGDVVSVYLPLGLRDDSTTLSSRPTWKDISLRRLQSYMDAKLTNFAWSPSSDFSNMSWWHHRNFSLASVYHRKTDHLVNHDFFLPNSHILETYYREPPAADVETVRLGTEYENDKDLGPVRFNDFLRWAHSLREKAKDLKRMVIVGHGSWLRDFVAYTRRNGGLIDGSCERFGIDRLNNAAAVRIAGGKCTCLFNGAAGKDSCLT